LSCPTPNQFHAPSRDPPIPVTFIDRRLVLAESERLPAAEPMRRQQRRFC
jgi:hypothetical protein